MDSSKAAVPLCLLGTSMHAEGTSLLDEVKATWLQSHSRASRLAVEDWGEPLLQTDQPICTAQALCHSHCIQGSCEVQEVDVQEGDLHRSSTSVGWVSCYLWS